MWKILRHTRTLGLLTVITTVCITPANAQNANTHTTNHQSFGFNLPTPVNPHGFDEVRASDGTTCRSSISNGGPYLDVGGLTAQNQLGQSSGATAYGRLVIPLGKKPERLNCKSLYQLEIDRLRHELHLARSGLGSAGGGTSEDWAKTGWDNNTK